MSVSVFCVCFGCAAAMALAVCARVWYTFLSVVAIHESVCVSSTYVWYGEAITQTHIHIESAISELNV